MSEMIIDMIGGNCPVQAEGHIGGQPFYFRARGTHWSIGIGGDVVGEPDWYHEEEYPGGPFAAGWMSETEARQFIRGAADRYLSEKRESDDGQPTEAQEWHDYDRDC